MRTLVRSSRLKRGGYQLDMSPESQVRIVGDQHLYELESEVRLLRKELDQAREQLRTEFETEAEKRDKITYMKGVAAGKKEGSKATRASMQAEVDKAGQIIKDLADEICNGLDTVWEECRKNSLELTLIIAEKIVGTIAQEYEGLVKDLTARGMAMVRDQTKIQILVNNKEAEYLRSHNIELLSLTEGVKEIEIIEQPSVKPGSVIIETAGGQIDARIDEQLAVVNAALKPGWSKPEADSDEEESSD